MLCCNSDRPALPNGRTRDCLVMFPGALPHPRASGHLLMLLSAHGSPIFEAPGWHDCFLQGQVGDNKLVDQAVPHPNSRQRAKPMQPACGPSADPLTCELKGLLTLEFPLAHHVPVTCQAWLQARATQGGRWSLAAPWILQA